LIRCSPSDAAGAALEAESLLETVESAAKQEGVFENHCSADVATKNCQSVHVFCLFICSSVYINLCGLSQMNK